VADDPYLPPAALLLRGLGITVDDLAQPRALVSGPFLRHLISALAAAAPFDAGHYAAANPDVAAAVKAGRIASLHHHFVTQGYFEGRTPCAHGAAGHAAAAAAWERAAAMAAGQFRSGLHVRLHARSVEQAWVQAFRPPLVAPPPLGFRGGPVLTDSAEDRRLRHTRYGQPVDSFDVTAAIGMALDVEATYAGPAYHHFGHILSEMVHRIIPGRRMFGCDRWLLVGTIGERPLTGFAELPQVQQDILHFLELPPERVHVAHQDMRVRTLHVVEAGSDFGFGPKPGYLRDLRAFSLPRLDRLHGDEPGFPRIYVSRSGIAHGGNFLGERYLERLLEDEGYAVVQPERLPFTRQMDLYRKAELVLFPEGSACHGVELLGEGMMGRCVLLVRRENHRHIFERVLAPRAASFAAFSGAIPLGTIVAHPVDGSPLDHLGVALFDLEALQEFLRAEGLARLPTLDRRRYFEAAAADLAGYVRHHGDAGSALLPGAVAALHEGFSREAQKQLRMSAGAG